MIVGVDDGSRRDVPSRWYAAERAFLRIGVWVASGCGGWPFSGGNKRAGASNSVIFSDFTDVIIAFSTAAAAVGVSKQRLQEIVSTDGSSALVFHVRINDSVSWLEIIWMIHWIESIWLYEKRPYTWSGNSADKLRMPRICCLFSSWISSRFSACGACLHYYPWSIRHAAPHLWNKLPPRPSLRIPSTGSIPSFSGSHHGPVFHLSYGAFHSRLKTHLFIKSFPP